MDIVLKSVKQPGGIIPDELPEIPQEVYEKRLESLREKMDEAGLDFIIIYGDREHASNFQYLMNFEPRFEEGILIVPQNGSPVVLLGNENLTLADVSKIEVTPVLFPSLSFISQPRNEKQEIKKLLADAGIQQGSKVGIAGWKYFTKADAMEGAFEVPHYLVEAVRQIAGERNVTNQTQIFMKPGKGLRLKLEVSQIARFEYSATIASHALLSMLNAVKPEMSELELASHYISFGVPLCCHPMLSFREKARYGLLSPASHQSEKGDFLTSCFGVEGALTSRAAYIAESEKDLDKNVRDWIEKLAKPYFATAYYWLKHCKIGVKGGDIYSLVQKKFPQEEYGWSLNPGHYIAYDEWVSSPIFPNSTVLFESGTYMQLDLIPGPKPPYYGPISKTAMY